MTPASALQQLFYVSRAVGSADSLDQILAQARRKNELQSVTGTLMFTGGHFAQLLEGPQAVLAQTMTLIERDPRHESVRQLLSGTITERRCGDWHMAFVEAPGADDLIEQLLIEPVVTPERAERLLVRLLNAAS